MTKTQTMVIEKRIGIWSYFEPYPPLDLIVEDNHHPIQSDHHHRGSLFDIHDHHAKRKIFSNRNTHTFPFLLEQIPPARDRYFSPGILRTVSWPRHSIIRAVNRIDLGIEWLIDRRE